MMKFKLRTLLIVSLIASMLLCMFPTMTPRADEGFVIALPEEGFAGGDGSSSDPWIIETPQQLDLVRKYLGTGNGDKYFKLGCDIDMAEYLAPDGDGHNGGNGWIPIGKSGSYGSNYQNDDYLRFCGTFDGDGYVIKNLTVKTIQEGAGLFGAIAVNSVIKNLGIVGGSIEGSNDVGGLVGYMNGGTIENCYTDVTVYGKSSSIGGLVGYAHGYRANTIENCHAAGDVVGDGGVGGLVGHFNSMTRSHLMSNCYATGNVAGGFYVGGLVGQYGISSGSATIENCYATGDVSGISDTFIGVKEQIGGLVGYQSRTMGNSYMLNCFAMGSVTGSKYVGGLVGQQENSGFLTGDHNIVNCYATGSVNGDEYVGGLVGEQTCSSSGNNYITNCYAVGGVTASGGNSGGLIGVQSGFNNNVVNCYFDTEGTGQEYGVNGGNPTGVNGQTTEQMTEMDVLNSGGAMETFDTSIWAKRANNIVYSYYPELAVFYGDGLLDTPQKKASEVSVRVPLGSEPPQIYTVTFDGNGGTVLLEDETREVEEGNSLGSDMPSEPIRSGHAFLEWNTKEDGSGTAFTDMTEVSMDITVYAQWTIVNENGRYSVVYDGNGNTGGFAPVDFNNPYLYGDTVIVFGRGSLVRDGYSFLGWSTLYDAIVVEFVEGDTFVIVQDVVLFAVWSEGSSYQYTVTYHPGTYGTFEPQITAGLSFGDLTPQAPQVTGVEGWKFAGWNPMPTQTVTGSIVYTAQWELLEGDGVEYIVHYYLQGTTNKVADSKNVTGQMVGTIVTEVAITISGYTALAPTSITAPLNATNNVFIFYYTASSSGGGNNGGSGGGGSSSPKPPTTTQPPTTTPPNTTLPPEGEDIEVLSVWAFVNLVLSLVGLILVVILIVCVLLQCRQMQKGVEEDQGQSGGRQFVGGQQWHVGGQEEVEVKRQRQCRLFWCFLGVVMGVAGIIVFLLTEDINNPMTLVDKWTIINAILFIAEIIAIVFTFKHNKTKENKDHATQTTNETTNTNTINPNP